MDLISRLPESIAHRILSYLVPFDYSDLPPVDLVRMSVLSKTWFDLTASFPDLVFKSYDFTSQESFFKYVDYTTSRFCHQNVPAHTFRLRATPQEPAEFDIVNRCLELVLQKGVKVLVLEIYDPHESRYSSNPNPKYRLPDILLSVSMLKCLTICHCQLPSSLMTDVVNFKSLIRLILTEVTIEEEVIEYLITSCPLLQDVEIIRCDGFKSFCVYRHPNLQKVWIVFNAEFEKIDIEAPNLSHLTLADVDQRGAPRMNFASCKKLTRVSYYGRSIPNDFLSYFPFIENLDLSPNDDTCKNLKWSSHSLRTLVLRSDCDLEDIELNIPTLDVFTYGSAWQIVTDKCWPLLRDSNNMKSCMLCYPDCFIDAVWFHRLRQFLDKKNGFKVLSLYIRGKYCRDFIWLEDLDEIQFIDLEELYAIELPPELPPYELQHVELEIDTRVHSSSQLAFLEAVLWCCSPQHLTLRSSFPLTGFDDVVKFVCKKLLQKEDQGLTNIQIVSCPDGETISFIKQRRFEL